ncbi:ExbD/TolR family protein [Ferrimonas balearica]|uniref:ExbD/TolR family protein n=1 Tax=Ferrimonas balearica TaxID=44012 RepID=UPI001F1DF06D|nr:biopolymer transporter ExbD [Ferrimonas balearica]MBY6017064.1 biopolymer transporter ExbD [Halomonas denitrificans]MBY6093338.1 biopolymer transporter ExbD [Ferrimonas balearica]
MRILRPVPQQEDAQVDLTPMLDIVFIMLIFFIVTTSFVRESGIEVNRPEASTAASQAGAGLFVAINNRNEIYIDQRRIDIERVQANLERLRADQPESPLVIQADERAFNGVVVKVMDAAKAAGITDIALAAEPGQ